MLAPESFAAWDVAVRNPPTKAPFASASSRLSPAITRLSGAKTRKPSSLRSSRSTRPVASWEAHIELVTRNDETQPNQALLAFNDIKGTGVVAVIGPVFSNAALAVEPVAQREKIPYLSLAPAQEQVEPIKPYVFVVPPLSAMFAERLLQYMQSQRVTRIAVAHDSKSAYSVAGHAATAKLAPKYGVEIVRDEPYDTTTADFGPLFTHVRDSSAQVLEFWGSGPPGVTFTKQYAASGVKVPLYLTASQASKLWLDPVGPAAEGVTLESAIGVVGKFLPDGPQKRIVEQMATPFQQKYGYPPPQFAQDGYSACLLVFEAIKSAGSVEAEKVQQALEHMTLLTPNGRIQYSATDHSGLSPDYVSVNIVKGGQLVPTDWSLERLTKTIAMQ